MYIIILQYLEKRKSSCLFRTLARLSKSEQVISSVSRLCVISPCFFAENTVNFRFICLDMLELFHKLLFTILMLFVGFWMRNIRQRWIGWGWWKGWPPYSPDQTLQIFIYWAICEHTFTVFQDLKYWNFKATNLSCSWIKYLGSLRGAGKISLGCPQGHFWCSCQAEINQYKTS